MNKRTYPPCMLVVDGKEFILNDSNESRVREDLYEDYGPDQPVEEWIDGHCVNVIELQDIFPQYY